jgi:hypothetical protein
MITINAFTFQFDYAEDRIRLVGNLGNDQPRIDFWLTRRLALRLLDAGNQMVRKTSQRVSESPEEFKQALARFEHEEARQSMEVSAQPIPDTPENTPELLQRIDVSHRNGRYQLRLFGQSDPNEIAAVSVLTYAELHQVLHLIHSGCETLDWGAPDLFAGPAGESQLLQ